MNENSRTLPVLLAILVLAALFWLRPWSGLEMAEAPSPEITTQATSLTPEARAELEGELKVHQEALNQFSQQLQAAEKDPNQALAVPRAKAEELTRKLDQAEKQLSEGRLSGLQLRHLREQMRELWHDRAGALHQYLQMGTRAALPQLPSLDRSLLARLSGDPQAEEYRRRHRALQDELEALVVVSSEAYNADLAGRGERLTRVLWLRYRVLTRLAQLNALALFESPGPWLDDCLSELRTYPDRKYGSYLMARARLEKRIGGGRAMWLALATQIGQAAFGLGLVGMVVASAARRDRLHRAGLRGLWTWLAVWPVCQLGLVLVRDGVAEGVRPVFLLAALYALYRAYLQLAFGPLLQAIVNSRVGQKVGVRTRARRDLRLSGMVLWLQGCLNTVLLSLAGPGLLVATGETVTDLLVKLIYWLLSWSWRVELGEALAALLPGSPQLGQWVGRMCASPLSGLILAPLAIPAVILLSILHWLVRRTVRYEWAKRMTAGMLRRWMETGPHTGDQLAPVGESYRQAFQSLELASSAFWDQSQPQFRTALDRAVLAWQEGQGADSILVVHGPSGSGREEVITRLRERFSGQLEVVQLDLVERITQESELLEALTRTFHWESCASLEEAAARMRQHAPTLVLVPRAQRLFLATPGGFEALDRLQRLMVGGRRNHCWCLVLPTQSQRYLRLVLRERWVVGPSLRLPRWSETALREMLLQRHAAGGGELRYSQAVLRAAEATPGISPGSYYFHILRELSDGNPTVARELWLESARLDAEGQVVVGLPPRKPSHLLSGLPSDAAYVLAAVMRHGELSFSEASRVTALPGNQMYTAWERCQEIGVLTDQTGLGLSATRSWLTDLAYFLRERNLLDGD